MTFSSHRGGESQGQHSGPLLSAGQASAGTQCLMVRPLRAGGAVAREETGLIFTGAE